MGIFDYMEHIVMPDPIEQVLRSTKFTGLRIDTDIHSMYLMICQGSEKFIESISEGNTHLRCGAVAIKILIICIDIMIDVGIMKMK